MVTPANSSPLIIWLVLLCPIILTLPLIFSDRWANRVGQRFAGGVAVIAACGFLISVVVGLAVSMNGPLHVVLLSYGAVGLSLHLNTLTAVLLMLVSFIGAVVTRYSVNYLSGDDRQGTFARWLAATLGWVMLFIMAGNLVLMTVAWFVTSLCLHQLLTFYPERSAAQQSAWTKFFISRMADLSLVGAMILLWREFGTLELDALFLVAAEMQSSGATVPGTVVGSAFLLILAAVMKSAQFPFHSWLPDSLDSPTPVSALMHAGVINGGGVLIIRLSPVICLVPTALNVLVLVGAFTAVFASVVMLTQTSIKRSLAWSTVSQMGFMMLQCGLGAFALAALHIVGHSLYKSYAFLSSGSVVALTRGAWVPSGSPGAHPALLFFILSVSVSLTFSVGYLFGHHFTENPNLLVLGCIFMMALGYMLWNLWGTRFPVRLATWGVVAAAALAFSWFALHHLAIRLFDDSLPAYNPARSGIECASMIVILLAFCGLLVFQVCLPSLTTHELIRRLYVHASNGFYFGALVQRLHQRGRFQVRDAVATSSTH